MLIKAGVVCQRRHMMHSAITVGGKRKHDAEDCCNPCNKSAASPRRQDILLQQRLLWLQVSVSVSYVLPNRQSDCALAEFTADHKEKMLKDGIHRLPKILSNQLTPRKHQLQLKFRGCQYISASALSGWLLLVFGR